MRIATAATRVSVSALCSYSTGSEYSGRDEHHGRRLHDRVVSRSTANSWPCMYSPVLHSDMSQETSNYECLVTLPADQWLTTELCACRLMQGVPAACLQLGRTALSSVRSPVSSRPSGHMQITAAVSRRQILCHSLLALYRVIDLDLVRNCGLRELSLSVILSPFAYRLYTSHVKLKQFINYIVNCHENYLHACMLAVYAGTMQVNGTTDTAGRRANKSNSDRRQNAWLWNDCSC